MKNSTKKLDYIVHRIWDKFCILYPDMLDFSCPEVTFNNRLKSTAGRCFDGLNKIDLSTSLYIEFEHEFCCTIIPHEIAHQITYNFYGSLKMGHGTEWKNIMRAYGLEPKVFHNLFDIRQMRLMESDCK